MGGNEFWGFAFIGLIFWLIWHFDFAPFSDEITRYPISKECKKVSEKYTNCDWITAPRYSFKVMPEQQVVLSWPTKKTKPINKFSDCVIRDRKNWQCRNSFVPDVGFANGDWIQTDTEKYRHVSKTKWWVYYIFS